VVTGESGGYYEDFGTMGDLATALSSAFVYAGRWSAHRNRRHGRPPTAVPGWSFLGYAQNHDQIGNRATGDRLGASVSPARLRVAAALYLCAPFVPMVFQGEEWGATTPFQYFTSHEDPELGRAVSAGRRAEFAAFGWKAGQVPDPQDPATFERSKLDWDEPGGVPHSDLLEWYRALIALRRRTADLSDGRREDVRTVFDEEARWLVVERGAVTVAANLGSSEAKPPIRPGRLVLASEPDATPERLPPDSVVIVGPG
jgi:maltooligosyltrehalose trehalohydrolase